MVMDVVGNSDLSEFVISKSAKSGNGNCGPTGAIWRMISAGRRYP